VPNDLRVVRRVNGVIQQIVGISELQRAIVLDHAAWKAEYERCVLPPEPRPPAIIDGWPADTVPRSNEFLDEEWADFFGLPDDERELADRHEEFNPSEPFAEVVHV
jgi:hypothetical protein